MAKNVQIGSLIVTQDESGKQRVSIGLGKKSTNPKYSKYNVSVEVVVRDGSGKVIARQTDGFINLSDPRTKPDELLQAGIISEEKAVEMREAASKTPEKIRYHLEVSRTS
jgi:hypothetical protein